MTYFPKRPPKYFPPFYNNRTFAPTFGCSGLLVTWCAPEGIWKLGLMQLVFVLTGANSINKLFALYFRRCYWDCSRCSPLYSTSKSPALLRMSWRGISRGSLRALRSACRARSSWWSPRLKLIGSCSLRTCFTLYPMTQKLADRNDTALGKSE